MKNVKSVQQGVEKRFNNLTCDGLELFDSVTPVTITYDGVEYTIYETSTDTFTCTKGNIYGTCSLMKKDGVEIGYVERGYRRTRTLNDFREVYKKNNITSTRTFYIKFNKPVKLNIDSSNYIVLTYLIPEDSKVIDDTDILKEALIETGRVKENLGEYLDLNKYSLDDIVTIYMTSFGTITNPIVKNEEFYVVDHGEIAYMHGNMRMLPINFSMTTLSSLVDSDEKIRKLIDWNTAKYINEIEYDRVCHDRVLTGEFLTVLFKYDFKGLLNFVETHLDSLVITDDITEINNLSEEDLKNSYFINYFDENEYKEKYMLIKNYRKIWQVQRRISVELNDRVIYQSHIKDHNEFDMLCVDKAQTRIHKARIQKIISGDNETIEEEIELYNDNNPFISLYKYIINQNNVNINEYVIVNIDATISSNNGKLKEYKNYSLPVIYNKKMGKYTLHLKVNKINWK